MSGRATKENPDAEIAVLSAILNDPNVFWNERARLLPRLFTDPLHRDIMRAIAGLADKGREFSLGGIVDAVGVQEDQNVAAYVRALMDNKDREPGSDLIEVLAETWARRTALDVAGSLTKAMTEPGDIPFQERLDKALKRLEDVAAAVGTFNPFESYQAVERVLGRMRALPADKRRVETIPWFLKEIGQVLGGDIEPGHLIGLLSDSGAGKTSMALQQAVHASRNGTPVLFLSGDQTSDDCYIQMVSQALQLEAWRIRKPGLHLDPADRKLVEAVLGDLRALPLHVMEIEAPTVRQITRWVQDFVRHHSRPGLVIIDHDDIVEANHPRDDLHEKVRQIDRDLKATLRKTRCGGLYLMQRNAQGSNRGTGETARPIDKDLVGGARRRKSFDAILTVYRESMWVAQQARIARDTDKARELTDRAERLENDAELGGMKARFGRQGLMQTVKWDGKTTRYFSAVEERLRRAPELGLEDEAA